MNATQQNRVPALRFKDEPGNNYRDWEKVQFSCIAAKVNDIYNPTNNRSRFKSIELDSLMSNTGQLLNTYNSDEQKSMKSKFKVGDVLFGKLRPYLRKFYLARFDGVCTSEIWVLRPKSVPSNFLYQTVQSHMFSRVANIQSGTKMPRSDWRVVSQSEFKIPIDYKEQQKIAAFLSSVDTKIEQLGKKKALLEQYKKGMMQKLFSQEIRFKDEQGNNYPDWEEIKLGNIGDIIGGGTPDTDKKKLWDGDIVWFTPTEIKSKYSKSSVRKISRQGLAQSSATLLPIGTILFTSRATIGEVSIAGEECSTNQGFQSFIVNNSLFSNEYTYYWIILNKKRFLRRANGSTFLEVSKSEIKKILFDAPNKEEQKQIANFLSAIDRKIELVDAEIKQAQVFKKGLFQQMFV